MVITVSCPSCSSSFPVDSNKIPEGGVNARCSTCGDVFRIDKPEEAVPASAAVDVSAPDPAPVAAPPAPEVEPVAPPPLSEPAVEAPSSLGEVDVLPPEVEEALTPEAPPTEEPAEEPAVEVEAEAEAAPAGFRFGKRDPADKAKRLARVLVSDMIMYNAERHTTALEAGTLREDFEEEIDKSWKEFVEQVGADMAEGPGQVFWTEALNDILAKGEELF